MLHHPEAAPDAAKSGEVRGTPKPSGTFSTGLGTDESSRARRAVLVYKGKPRPGEKLVKDEIFEQLRQVLALLVKQGFEVGELAVGNPGGREAWFRDWLRADGQPIACLVAQLRRGEDFYWL